MSSLEIPQGEEIAPLEGEQIHAAAATRAIEAAFSASEHVVIDDTDLDDAETVLVVRPPVVEEVTTPVVELTTVEHEQRPPATQVEQPVTRVVKPTVAPASVKPAEVRREEPAKSEVSVQKPAPEQDAAPVQEEALPPAPVEAPKVVADKASVETTQDTVEENEAQEAPPKVESKEVATASLRVQERESKNVAEHRPDPPADDPEEYLSELAEELRQYASYEKVPSGDIEEIFFAAQDAVLELMDGSLPPPQEKSCEFAFSRQALQLIGVDNRLDPFKRDLLDGYACVEAELQLIRSLEFDEGERSSRKPFCSVVLFDTNGEPYAYQKTAGVRSAYVWREAEVQTQEGVKWVPKDCFIEVDYSPEIEDNPGIYDPEKKVVAPPELTVDSIRFYRFSTASLRSEAKEAIAAKALVGSNTLRPFAFDATTFTPRDIGERVNDLLEKIVKPIG